jgi:hypothetical protein
MGLSEGKRLNIEGATFMKRLYHALCFFPAAFIFLIALICLAGCGNSAATQKLTERLTARMLVAPNALMGPGPSGFCWSPKGAVLAYVEPKECLPSH